MLAGTAFAFHPNQQIEALLLDALARTRSASARRRSAASSARSTLAEPQGHVWILLTVPGARELLAAPPRAPHGPRRAPAALLDHLAAASRRRRRELAEPLNERELAVLRFLPTNLSAAEIGGELFLSVHTVKTHMRKLYAKLDVHTRAEAVQRGRALGLLGAVAARLSSFTRIV